MEHKYNIGDVFYNRDTNQFRTVLSKDERMKIIGITPHFYRFKIWDKQRNLFCGATKKERIDIFDNDSVYDNWIIDASFKMLDIINNMDKKLNINQKICEPGKLGITAIIKNTYIDSWLTDEETERLHKDYKTSMNYEEFKVLTRSNNWRRIYRSFNANEEINERIFECRPMKEIRLLVITNFEDNIILEYNFEVGVYAIKS